MISGRGSLFLMWQGWPFWSHGVCCSSCTHVEKKRANELFFWRWKKTGAVRVCVSMISRWWWWRLYKSSTCSVWISQRVHCAYHHAVIDVIFIFDTPCVWSSFLLYYGCWTPFFLEALTNLLMGRGFICILKRLEIVDCQSSILPKPFVYFLCYRFSPLAPTSKRSQTRKKEIDISSSFFFIQNPYGISTSWNHPRGLQQSRLFNSSPVTETLIRLALWTTCRRSKREFFLMKINKRTPYISFPGIISASRGGVVVGQEAKKKKCVFLLFRDVTMDTLVAWRLSIVFDNFVVPLWK